MPRSRIAWLIVITAGLSGAWLEAGPKPRAGRRDAGTEEVKLVLQREQHSPIDRRAQLQDVLKRQPDLAAARWQSGYVEADKTWRSYSSPADPKLLDLLEQYRERRSDLDATVRSQLVLARWCRQQGLKDQERAHRLAALAIAKPDEQEPIRESLGHHRIGNQWMSPEDLDDLRHWQAWADNSRRRWSTEIQRLADLLEGNPGQRARALEALSRIRDPAAIPALDWALSRCGMSGSSALVKLLGDMPAYEASLSLARIAVFSQSADVRDAASKALRARRVEDFVPPLIQLLTTPAETTLQTRPTQFQGVLSYQLVSIQQTHDSIRVSRTTLQPRIGFESDWGEISERPFGSPVAGAAFTDTDRSLGDFLYDWHVSRERRRELDRRMNERVAGVLSTVSGKPYSVDPHVWWSWWADTADIHAASKRVVEEENVVQGAFWVIRHVSCFQAGTPVWTETGSVPIEEIQPGDRVLSQNPETGELAYKPVLHKSLGPRRPMIRVAAGDETLVCTDGHRFWLAGEGWIKARELSPKKLLHTAIRSIPVESVSEGPEDETHNLVVADFHSYFVGQQAFLVQDLPMPRSTNCVVPGLQPEW